MSEILIIIFAYLLGSIPFGVIFAKLLSDKDITKEGSGNIGATNVGRVVGKKAGILTLLCDSLKGVVPITIAVAFAGVNEWLISLAALAAFLGHLYPIFNNFKGGKGVATALGIFVVISPLSALTAVITFGLCVAIWRHVSLGSITAAWIMPALIGLFGTSKIYIILALIISALIIYRHRENIRRLMEGTESRLGEKKDKTAKRELEEELD